MHKPTVLQPISALGQISTHCWFYCFISPLAFVIFPWIFWPRSSLVGLCCLHLWLDGEVWRWCSVPLKTLLGWWLFDWYLGKFVGFLNFPRAIIKSMVSQRAVDWSPFHYLRIQESRCLLVVFQSEIDIDKLLASRFGKIARNSSTSILKGAS